MTVQIHSTAIVDKKAMLLGNDIIIGPYCVIGPKVVINDGCVIHSHCIIDGDTTLGANNHLFPFCAIGLAPQHAKFSGGKSKLIVGNNNIIREHVTMHPGTDIGIKVTKVGNDSLFMVGTHVAHDCIVGDNVVFVNGAVIGGHVEIGDFCYLGGHSAIHQFCRVGKHAIIGASTMVEGDVIPYSSVIGGRGNLSGLNLVGLKRRNFKREEIKVLRQVYRLLFAPEGTFNERLFEVKEAYNDNLLIKEILTFLSNDSNRPLIHPKMDKF